MNLAEQVTLAFVISLALLSLLTAGLSLVTQEYLLFSLIFSVGGSLTALGLYILTRGFRRIRPSNLKSLPRLLLLCLVAYCILLAASFWSAPYYPSAETPDLINHTHLIQAVLAGDGRNVLLHGNTPVGLHFVSALMAYVLQLAPLESLRIVGALVLLAIVSMFYSSARRMFDSDAAGSIIMLIGSFVLPADLIHFIRAGTYPNLLEDCLILGLLWLLVSYVDQPSKTVGASMSLLTVAGVFAHSSSFLFLAAAVISVPFVYLVAPRASFRNYVRALLYCLTALVLFAAVLWPFFRGNLGRITGAYVELGQPLALSVLHVSYFVFVYDLGYLLGWVNVALLFASVLVALFMSKKSVWSVLLLVWLGVQFVSPVFSEQGFRFVLLGMVPGSFIIGKGLADFGAWGKLGSTRWNNVKPRLLPILLIVLILSGSLPGLIPKAGGGLRFHAVAQSAGRLPERGQQWLTLRLPISIGPDSG
jgi:hypothetical protein